VYRPLKISDTPPAYVLLKPKAVRLQTIAFSDTNMLTIRAAIDGACLTEIADNPPASSQAAALPPLVQEAAIDPKFRVVAPLALNLPTVNSTIRSHWNAISLKLDQSSSVEIRNVSFYSKSGLLYVKASLHGQNQSIRCHRPSSPGL
jgi:hypothetical protein